MKKLILSTLLMSALSTHAYAQDYGSVEDPSKAFERMKEMGACIDKIDKNLIQQLVSKGEKNQQEMEKLCAAGKRKEAQAKYLAMYDEGMKDPTAIKMKACADIMFSDPDSVHVTEDTSTNICDAL